MAQKTTKIEYMKKKEINFNESNTSDNFDGLEEEEYDEDVTPELIEELERLREKNDFIEVKDLKKYLGV